MKNKIIILLMFALVVVLAVVAWQSFISIDQDRSEESGNDELIIENAEKRSIKPELDIKETEYVPSKDSPTIDSSDDTKHDIQDKERDDEGLDPKLCELVETYDDWQKTSTGYTSQKLIDEIRSWGDKRGYFEMEYNGSQMQIKKTSDYDYYETKDLQQMADAGDSIANVKMAYRLFLQGDEAALEEAQPYCERAIIDGYSAMHGCVITYLNNLLAHHENQEEPDLGRIKELELESLAWKEMYKLRNDPLGEIMFDSSMSTVEGVEVTDEEIEQRADALYRDLAKKRINLGLGPFIDTKAPDVIVYAVNHGVNEKDIERCFESSRLGEETK